MTQAAAPSARHGSNKKSSWFWPVRARTAREARHELADDYSRSGSTMTEREAHELVRAHLNRLFEPENDGVVVLDGATVRKPYGWVFFYQSRRYVESGNPSDMLAGNGPIVVFQADGSIHELGTAYPIEVELRSFEERMNLRG
jgi:hypothetical protein